MPRIQEVRHPGEPWLMFWLGNLTAMYSELVKSIAFAWLFKENGKWVFKPRVTGQQSLFFNAVFFVRITVTPVSFLLWAALLLSGMIVSWLSLLGFGVFASIRWSGEANTKALLQAGVGWKLNGRLAVLLRIQSDASSAAGVTGPNYGQATGFNYGTH